MLHILSFLIRLGIFWRRINMVKLKNLIHTILHFILWLTILSYYWINNNIEDYGGLSISEIVHLEIPIYLGFFLIYVITGLLFDYFIFLSKKYKQDYLVITLRITFIIIVSVFSIWLFWIIFVIIS